MAPHLTVNLGVDLPVPEALPEVIIREHSDCCSVTKKTKQQKREEKEMRKKGEQKLLPAPYIPKKDIKVKPRKKVKWDSLFSGKSKRFPNRGHF